MEPFDPYSQNITLLVPSPSTSTPVLVPVPVPIPLIDSFNDETVSITINYGTQLGASITMLLVVLFTTPSSKMLRASNVLHISALVVCVVRTVFLVLYFLSPFSHFYQVWSGDYSQVPAWNYRTSIAGTVFSSLLTVVTDAALMNQAWTMVSLWPSRTKYLLCFLSMLVTLLAVSFRLAFTIIQCKGIYDLVAPTRFAWLIHTTLIFHICSICWFCALFNSKLIIHLVTNRGVLPSRRAMSPMEVLIMANGILMIVPVIFAILEWHHFINFESGSLTPTSVAIALPLGSLAAQRLAQANQSASSDLSSYPSSSAGAAAAYHRHYKNARDSGSRTPLKAASLFSTTTNSSTAAGRPHALAAEASATPSPARDVIDPIDLELRQIDGYLQPKEMRAKAESSESQFHK
ncbi:pheromone receptor 2 [Trichoderma cornu-damae]|uniref:Pheromone receptor 2 n=1 Tax=Trichoderma cornu-damae TaxID=654480 RepID=A0A9P8TUQ0_9HYPO|nr:pheromone receptor 2 [Trichoderma cornu-damae]